MLNFISLGQTGFKIIIDNHVIYIDPYLSNSLELKEGKHLKRQVPIKIEPNQINDAEWVLITHIHQDHCDLETLLAISLNSPKCIFLGPFEVINFLESSGINKNNLLVAKQDWVKLLPNFKVHPTPAAHPVHELDKTGNWRCIGFIFQYNDLKIYHAGDTFVTSKLIQFIKKFKPIHMAMLPVNEHNFFKEQIGIIGNMTVRDAFSFASLLEVAILVPTHWDMFKVNEVFKEEIEIVYKKLNPDFKLIFEPEILNFNER